MLGVEVRLPTVNAHGPSPWAVREAIPPLHLSSGTTRESLSALEMRVQPLAHWLCDPAFSVAPRATVVAGEDRSGQVQTVGKWRAHPVQSERRLDGLLDDVGPAAHAHHGHRCGVRVVTLTLETIDRQMQRTLVASAPWLRVPAWSERHQPYLAALFAWCSRIVTADVQTFV